MAFGNISKKSSKKSKVQSTGSGYAIAEDTLQSVIQVYLQSISFLDDNKDITSLKFGEPVKNKQGIVTRWIDVTTKENRPTRATGK